MPPVPLSVRLRAWRWHEKEHFSDYVCKRSQEALDLDRRSVLAAGQVERLAEAGRLLPLYDGFDELADDASVRRAALNGMKRFTARFVLSARPGHGAEEIVKENDKCRQHTLRELTVPDAEMFIRQRLKITEGQKQDPALDAYRRAQPYINELFRRPLFLVAWCVSYQETPDHPAVTISELMDVVLEHVFVKRVFKKIAGLPVKRVDDVHRLRHELGAVLAAYAEEGFGAICYPSKIDAGFNKDQSAIGSIAVSAWRKLAIRAGLLITAGKTCYVIKTPVVEYLIGSYYAWLVKPSEGADDSPENLRRRQLFISKFRHGFWWREFDDIWMYSFDQLWRGESAEVDMAHEMVRWLLDYSKRCLNSGQFSGELLPGQTDEDRDPHTCHRFALRIMLPFGPVSPVVDHHVEQLLNIGLDQIMDESLRRWRYLRNTNASLELLAKRWSAELIERLKRMLAEIPHQQEWDYIAHAIASCFGGMESAAAAKIVADTLVPCLGKPIYKDIWGRIADTIGSGFKRMESAAVQKVVADTLVPCLGKPASESTRMRIANTIGSGFARMESAAAAKIVADTLVPCLGKPIYRDAWGYIPSAIVSGLERMESVAVEKVVAATLVPCLDKSDHRDAWGYITYAIGRSFARMESAAIERVVVDTLVPYLGKPDYRDVWGRIAYAIGNGFERMESAAVQKVVADTLVPCLGKPGNEDAWRYIAKAIGSGFARMESATVQKVVVETLAPCLGKPAYKDACGSIADAIGSGFKRMDSAAIEKIVAAALVTCLGNALVAVRDRQWGIGPFVDESGCSTIHVPILRCAQSAVGGRPATDKLQGLQRGDKAQSFSGKLSTGLSEVLLRDRV